MIQVRFFAVAIVSLVCVAPMLGQGAQNNKNDPNPKEVHQQETIQKETRPLREYQEKMVKDTVRDMREHEQPHPPSAQQPPAPPPVAPLTDAQRHSIDVMLVGLGDFLSTKQTQRQDSKESVSQIQRNGVFMAAIVESNGRSAAGTSTISPERALQNAREAMVRGKPGEEVHFAGDSATKETSMVRFETPENEEFLNDLNTPLPPPRIP